MAHRGMSNLIVAIDGPAGSGKSSVSKQVARQLHFGYLDMEQLSGLRLASFGQW
jgi:cytidylate kinase